MIMHLDQIHKYIQELSKYAWEQDVVNEKVSKASVYRHIDHALRSTKTLLTSITPNTSPHRSFNFIFWMITTFGWIPRWVAKSPEWTYSTNEITSDSLQTLLQEVWDLVALYESVENGWMTHRDFGDISEKKTLQFASIHIHHHLKIIRDIKKSEVKANKN